MRAFACRPRRLGLVGAGLGSRRAASPRASPASTMRAPSSRRRSINIPCLPPAWAGGSRSRRRSAAASHFAWAAIYAGRSRADGGTARLCRRPAHAPPGRGRGERDHRRLRRCQPGKRRADAQPGRPARSLGHYRRRAGRDVAGTRPGAHRQPFPRSPRLGSHRPRRRRLSAGRRRRLRAAAYRGWRLPTLNELYRPFRAGADATAAQCRARSRTADRSGGRHGLAPHALADAPRHRLLEPAARRDRERDSLPRGPAIFPASASSRRRAPIAGGRISMP